MRRILNNRPELNAQISPEDFQAFYWLKEELVAFCRTEGLSTLGGKAELTARILAYLQNGAILVPARSPRRAGAMPEQFTPEMVIGQNWHCSQALRAFFEQELGPGFHFNGVMRDFIREGAGRTLREAMQAWMADQNQPTVKEIAPQFEYNQHIRDYFVAHPGETLEEAIKDWKLKRAGRRN